MADTSEDSQISRVLIERQFVTSDEIRAAAEQQKILRTSGAERPLTDVMIDLGFLTRTQLSRVQGGSDDSGSRPAQQIPGYQLQRRVGAGAMAVVYKAKQLSLDRVVAIKVLPKRLSKNVEFVERFYREGRAAAKLNHPNIVQAIDVGESGGFHYFVMEFVEGCTVYDELAGGKAYDEKEAIAIATQIASALLHAHERGFIHRDVKPKNVMLTNERIAKLADMGLAREMTDLEAAMAEAGRAYGTPYYISPEQIRGEVTIDIRCDIYSLGGTLYHMVTGRVPFEGPTPSAVMHKHLREPLVPPDHISTKLSSGFASMIEMMMAKNRDDRYASCREVLADLELLARGQPPKYARGHLDADSLTSLSSGRNVEYSPEASGSSRGAITVAHAGPPVALIVMSIVAALSVLLNVILLVAR
ncbi:MAG: serine/threonine protein kinase [Phycisphaerales bacterium]|nr:serine/threonine protein kinase [Phycisphaerales bacterium]